MTQLFTEEARAAVMSARAAALRAQVTAMEIANEACRAKGVKLMYDADAFLTAIDMYHCGHNGITMLMIHGELG